MEKEFISKIVCGKTSLILLLFWCLLPEVPGFSGGETVDAEEYSYMVQIFKYDWEAEIENYVCGGALLKSNWVITAAHCIIKDENGSASYTVYAGLKEVAEEGKDKEFLYVNVIVIHKKYNMDYVDHCKTKGHTVYDIALLKLDGEFKCQKKVRFPTDEMINNLVQPQTALFITGYGCKNEECPCENHTLTSLKKKCMRGVVEGLENIAAWRKVEKNEGRIFYATNDNQPGLGSGDSGSPLVVESDENFYIFGIASMAGHCNKDYPVIFTNVNYFKKWIECKINENS